MFPSRLRRALALTRQGALTALFAVFATSMAAAWSGVPTAEAAEIHVHYDTGFGNRIAIRGSGGGLSWSTGRDAGWTSGNDWVLTTPEEAGGFDFKPLINDSVWSTGANYRVPAGDSVVHIYPYFGPARGSFETIPAVHSQHLQNQRDIVVYLPPSYRENPLKRYPVLYMHDGQNLYQAGQAFGGVEWQVDETLDRLIGTGAAREVIVVGIANNANRIAEYTPVADAGYGGGNGEAYLNFIEHELVPLINARYRSKTGPAHTFIGGSSLGGLISFWAGWTRSHVFGTAICISSSFWWNQRFAVDTVDNHVGGKVPTRFFIDAGGQNDGADDTAAMRDALVRKGYVHGSDLFHWFEPSGRHNEASWAARFHRPVEFLLPFLGQ